MSELPFIVIPAFEPNGMLESTLSGLLDSGFERIIVINDGSKSDESLKIFDRIKSINKIIYIEHGINLGKGGALKSGFNRYILERAFNDYGVITVDADGQHNPLDVLRVAKASMESEMRNALLIGAREFSKDFRVPFRSKFGNILTKKIFNLIFSQNLKDTQSGLRYIPNNFLKDCLAIESMRYEYEMEMLIKASLNHVPIHEVEIKTIYIANNESSHFNPLIDSFKIYYVFLRYTLNSIITAFIDYIVFSVFFYLIKNLLFSLLFARLIAGTTSFLLSKNFVFLSKSQYKIEAIRFISLVSINMLIAYLFIYLATNYYNLNIYISKIIIEFLLFIIGFFIMKFYVFRSHK